MNGFDSFKYGKHIFSFDLPSFFLLEKLQFGRVYF